MSSIKISVDYLKLANYALYHNRIPICQSVEVTNTSEAPIENLKIACDGEFIVHFESEIIPGINPGETVKLSSFNVAPDSSKLTTLTERIMTSFKISAISGCECLSEEVCEIEFMPYDHWTGTKILPQTIASFITPNHPSVNNIVVKSAAILKAQTGSSSLKEYQTGNPNDVRQQIAAVFAAVHGLGIVYRGMPASFEALGQRVTMPDQLISSKIGNCIELTLLMATVLEAIGINTIIIIQKQHAYLGVWLVDDCYSCSVCDDPAFIEKKCSHGIDEMCVLECTQVTQENTSFEEAMRIAELNLANHSVFEMFIDVKRSRLERIFPLPARIENNGTFEFDTSGVNHDSCRIEVKEHDRFDLSRISSATKQLTKFDIWERKLLDFSLRNSLLNLSLRHRAIQFISFDVNKIEDQLQDGKEYSITSKPNIEFQIDTSENLVRTKLHEPLRDLILNDMEHHLLHTFLPEGETKLILKNIYRAARNAIEETGANCLFLALGTLRWFETEHSATPRYAPLLLLPVEIVYKKGNYYIRTRDEEIALNITLMEFLRQNYDITINGLNPLPLDNSGVDVPLIFAIIRDALKEQKRWDIEEEAVLGTFSFSKFLMWNDVHSHREELTENDIINSLVANRLTWTPNPVASDLKDIDIRISPVDTALPMPVDSSQMAAVLESGNSNSFILYGPPGTGKSQTITNIIANALYHGKRVLFVAEKMAALSVVQKRLEKIGLDSFCLELHSNKSTKRHVLQQLEKALRVTHIVPPGEYSSLAEKIFSERKNLIAYMNALHTPDSSDGLSLYDCIVNFESLPGEPLAEFTFDNAIDSLLVREGTKGLENLLGSRFETVLELVGQPSQHPLNGLLINRAMLIDSIGTVKDMKDAAVTISKVCKDYSSLNCTKSLFEKLMRDNSPGILNEDPKALHTQWREAKSKWFLPRIFAKRNFINRLRQFNQFITADEIENLIDNLINYRENHARIASAHQILKQYFGADSLADELPEYSVLENAAAKLVKWSDHHTKMREWLHWSELCDELRNNGLGCIAEALSAHEINVSEVKNACLKALFKHKANEKISRSDVLVSFEGMLFDEKTAAYKRMTEEFQLLTQKELYARLASRVPRMTDNASSGSEIGLLNRNISNGGRGLSLRDLFDQLPTLMPRLCPCMLMSPMSVAQYIDLNSEKFDLVVFDEASQMPTSEAVGAIARGKTLIVVGDPKQMPPTSFFTSTNVDAEEACIDDMESILEDCRTLEMPSLQLSWHYRSRHESLIAFSNNEYYNGSLITFPSADDLCSKVHFIPVSGQYDKGGKRNNRTEAEAVVNEIARRLSNEELRKQSIGVIAFSIMQQGLIEDLLQERLDKDKALQEAATQMYEPIFIKNLENVQGDERDVVLFSIGYGPTKEGKISMNFGPLNNAGGERRLNVAVSRARQEMYIYSSLKSTDIDLRRTKARGVEGLKHFLQYAETQSLPSIARTCCTTHSTHIAGQIAFELQKHGYDAAINVGRSQFRVDVAVRHKNGSGRYCLGILLDGEGYRDTHTTRDREVVQPSVLNSLNWEIMRVWSVDWFNNKERVISRIINRLKEERKEVTSQESKPTFDISSEEVLGSIFNSIPYSKYSIDVTEAISMPDESLLRNIITIEQPMEFIYLCRRVNALRGAGRITPTLQRTLKAYEHGFYIDNFGAWWLRKDDSNNYDSYRTNSGREISEIPKVEIINVIRDVLVEQVALDENNLTLAAAKKLGFNRRGANVDAAFKDAMEAMMSAGTIEVVGENIRLKETL